MRLIGVELDGHPPPVASGYVELDELTVLFGANDSGKSRTLRAIESHLLGEDLRPQLSPEDPAGHPRIRFFAIASQPKIDLLVAGGIQDLFHRRRDLVQVTRAPGDPRDIRDRMPTIPDAVRRDARTLGLELPAKWPVEPPNLPGSWRDAWITLLGEAIPDANGRALLGALRGSSIVAFEARGPQRVSAYLCLPSKEALSLETQRVLGTSPWPSEIPGRPIPLAPIGEVSPALLPLPVAVPRGPGARQHRMEEAINGLLQMTREGVEAAREGVRLDDVAISTSPWLQDNGRLPPSVAPSVFDYVEGASAAATSLLPDFVRERYSVELHVRGIQEWDRDGRLEVRLKAANGSDPSFPIEAAADGYQLWLELCLRETASEIDRFTVLLGDLLDDAAEEVFQAEESLRAAEVPDVAVELESVPAWQEYQAARARVGQGEFLDVLQSAGRRFAANEDARIRRLLDRSDPDGFGAAPAPGVVRPTFYLIDEPERHLHPRLQRVVRTWLEELMRTGRNQCLVASHSQYFLSASEHSTLAQLIRGPAEVLARTLHRNELVATSAFARELGFDRGELLTQFNLLLFVEGRADEIVLRELYGSRLQRAGVLVVPLHGARRLGAILEVETLKSLTTAVGAALLDGGRQEEIDRVRRDAAYRREATGGKGLISTLAAFIQAALEVDREFDVYTHPARDIFDLLDEDVLQRIWPRFPGHRAARASCREAGRSGLNEERKKFYKDAFGIPPGLTTYRRAAKLMAQEGRSPADLDRVIDQIIDRAARSE